MVDAKEYLQFLQESEQYKRRVLTETAVDIEERIKLYKKISMDLAADPKSTSQPKSYPERELGDALKAMMNLSLPTKYEDPFIYHELMRVYKHIDRAANHPKFLLDPRFSRVKNLYPHKRSPIIGTTLLGRSMHLQ